MTTRLYDTSARQIRDFVPLVPGCVSIYLCGATVQAPPHIGHIRSGLNFDILRRWLEYRGHRVTLVRNVTDIDDKIIRKAAEQDRPWWELAYTNERAFNHAYDVLGCLPPALEPRATGHVPEMTEMMRVLIERGHAYPAEGSVYFDVGSYPDYLALSNQELENLRQPAAEEEPGKRDHRDFALWKAAKPGEPSWPTPWGPGRPGWHLECSAMAHKYLGQVFDIHGGGVDLVFPHHENEIAQSRSFGDGFARYWVHNAWVTMADAKMSKSLGNSVLVSEMVKQVRPVVLRYYLGAAHYRSTIEYSAEALREAESAYGRIESFVRRVVELAGPVGAADEVPPAFAEAMDDDLGVPQALAVVHTTVRQGNSALSADDKESAMARLAEVRAMLGVLGLDPLDEQWAGERSAEQDALPGVVDRLVRLVLEQREAARARKDYATADAMREQLARSGLVIEDTPSGPRWQTGAPRRGPPSKSPAQQEQGRQQTMAGNSQRKNRRTSNKKGAQVGTGGHSRKALRGKGPTPRAEMRTGHPKQRAAAAKAKQAARRPQRRGTKSTAELVTGRNPVVEALRAQVPASALYVQQYLDNDDRVREALTLATGRSIPLLEAPKPELDRLTGHLNHQGLALQVPPYDYAHPDDLTGDAADAAEEPLVVALDGVTDPRNLGAVVRSVAAFGGHGVVVPERRAAGMTAGAWKASAGTAAQVRVARATNLTRALEAYQKAGLLVVGLAADGDLELSDLEVLDGPVAVVIGSEGRGLSRLVRETCDLTVRIAMPGGAESLNAGVAAGIVLYEAARRRARS